MKQNEIDKFRKAYIDYNLNIEYGITENVLKYIKERINFNEEECQKIIKINKESITFSEILETINNEIKAEKIYKKDGQIKLYNNNFVFATLTDSVGIIAVECFDTIEVIKYLIRAIKSRNSIVISDVEYNEYSVKSFILLIMKEALKKFKIDENLINIIPYEECSYNLFDRVIYTYKKDGQTLDINTVKSTEETKILYIYMEDEFFRDNVDTEIKRIKEKQEEVKLITGDMDNAIDIINRQMSQGASIYTQDAKQAYRFINLVKAKNVFVNASLINIKKVEPVNNELYLRKNVIFQIPTNKKEKVKDEESKITEELEKITTNEVALTKVSVGILEKIKLIFKKIFKGKK